MVLMAWSMCDSSTISGVREGDDVAGGADQHAPLEAGKEDVEGALARCAGVDLRSDAPTRPMLRVSRRAAIQPAKHRVLELRAIFAPRVSKPSSA